MAAGGWLRKINITEQNKNHIGGEQAKRKNKLPVPLFFIISQRYEAG